MQGGAATLGGSEGAPAVGGHAPAVQIVLRKFEIRKSGSVTFYTLSFTQGLESWSVERRYSEFLRCHVQLLEIFGRDELPPFPPKEPVLQKIFGRGGARNEWAEERRGLLQQYLVGLLAHKAASEKDVVLHLIGAPCGVAGGSIAVPLEAGAVLISGVRVRLTGEPGGIEVVVRAEAIGTCTVRLALRRLGEKDGELTIMPPLTDLGLEDMDVWERWLELELTESEVGGNSEAAHRFLLEPGSLWQVGAVGVGPDGSTGNAVCIQLRAPTETEMAQLPRRASAESGGPKEASGGAAAVAAAARRRVQGLEDEDDEAEEEDEEEVWAEARLPGRGPGTDEPGGSAVWEVTHTMTRKNSADSASGGEAFAEASQSRSGAAADADSSTDGSPAGKAKAELAAEAKSMPTSKAKAAQSSESDKRSSFFLKDSARRLMRGPEVHKVICYTGNVAAEYTRKIEEKNRAAVDRAPHRFETTGAGQRRSVAQSTLKIVTNGKQEPAPESRRMSAELLDRGREAQQLMRLKEDERCSASWIHAVTGDARVQAAAQDECSLLVALESGEALCDLVNAVWPGRIVGIHRGNIKPYKRLDNVSSFIIACKNLGIPEHIIFTPTDLTERKNLGSVVRCIFALGGIVPDPPEYSGPRLEESVEQLLSAKDSAAAHEGGVGSGGGSPSNARVSSSSDLTRRATM